MSSKRKRRKPEQVIRCLAEGESMLAAGKPAAEVYQKFGPRRPRYRRCAATIGRHGGGGLKQGQNVVYQSKVTPLANLWLSMLRHVGVNTSQFANSKRVLTELGFK